MSQRTLTGLCAQYWMPWASDPALRSAIFYPIQKAKRIMRAHQTEEEIA